MMSATALGISAATGIFSVAEGVVLALRTSCGSCVGTWVAQRLKLGFRC
jgi:hypothetical protein